jgi:RNase P subunit RPR2
MKIIRECNPPEIKYTFTCRKCKTTAIAHRNEGRNVHDPRDGNAIVFECPSCKNECWVNYDRHNGGW